MTVLASANAHAVFANAYATVQFGVAQTGFFGANNADFEFNNNGNLDVTAVANADGIFAHAGAYVTGGGITQYATANGGLHSANVAVNNSADGVINIGATANANAVAFGYATAYLSDGISQQVHGNGGADASAAINNDGAINITAAAHVGAGTYTTGAYNTVVTSGPFVGSAQATINNAIVQDVDSTGNAYTTGNASALIANDGTISINAQADAFASETDSRTPSRTRTTSFRSMPMRARATPTQHHRRRLDRHRRDRDRRRRLVHQGHRRDRDDRRRRLRPGHGLYQQCRRSVGLRLGRGRRRREHRADGSDRHPCQRQGDRRLRGGQRGT